MSEKQAHAIVRQIYIQPIVPEEGVKPSANFFSLSPGRVLHSYDMSYIYKRAGTTLPQQEAVLGLSRAQSNLSTQ